MIVNEACSSVEENISAENLLIFSRVHRDPEPEIELFRQ